MRKTKIVCTIGPATSSEAMIEKLVNVGMDVARLNFSHGSHDDHKKVIDAIRSVSVRMHKPITILQDLQGPKLRTGKIKNGKIELVEGATISITTDEVLGTSDMISTSYKYLPDDVKIGDIILLDDGMMQLQVTGVEPKKVICEVIEGGYLSDHKGINLPNVAISQPSLTSKDRKDLDFGIANDVDLVAMSFVRSADDVQRVKDIIAENGKQILVVAKLEKPEAIEHLEEIMYVTDGVMVARGDLGVEVPLEKVPPLQKKIIHLAMRLGKPVITATQMLESMRFNSRPTRAEVSDVANAIFDGSDAVMLSAETAVGQYPVETIKTMHRIIVEAERTLHTPMCQQVYYDEEGLSIPDAISRSACEAADGLDAKAIVAFTKSGFTGRQVSKYRPGTSIITFTPSAVVKNQLNLSWGVIPMNMEFKTSTEEIIKQMEELLLQKQVVQRGDVVVILMGAPIYIQGTTNLMKLHVIGDGSDVKSLG